MFGLLICIVLLIISMSTSSTFKCIVDNTESTWKRDQVPKIYSSMFLKEVILDKAGGQTLGLCVNHELLLSCCVLNCENHINSFVLKNSS